MFKAFAAFWLVSFLAIIAIGLVVSAAAVWVCVKLGILSYEAIRNAYRDRPISTTGHGDGAAF